MGNLHWECSTATAPPRSAAAPAQDTAHGRTAAAMDGAAQATAAAADGDDGPRWQLCADVRLRAVRLFAYHSQPIAGTGVIYQP